MGFYANYVFPKFFDLVVQHKAFDAHRAETLKLATGKILEIGIGTGINLEFYPKSVSHITAVEPNSGMEKQLKAKLPKHHLTVDFHLTGAEKMPFPDASFDTVISTITMCSIPNLAGAMKEIQRILTPNGKFVFLDHGLSKDPWVAKLQNFLNPFQNIVGCGCSLTVDVEKVLLDSGFKVNKCETFYVENAPKFIGHVYKGIATLN